MSTAFDPLDAATVDYADGGGPGPGVSTALFVRVLLMRASFEGEFIKAAMRRLITETVESLATEMQKGH
jgi:hypothetical protein